MVLGGNGRYGSGLVLTLVKAGQGLEKRRRQGKEEWASCLGLMASGEFSAKSP